MSIKSFACNYFDELESDCINMCDIFFLLSEDKSTLNGIELYDMVNQAHRIASRLLYETMWYNKNLT